MVLLILAIYIIFLYRNKRLQQIDIARICINDERSRFVAYMKVHATSKNKKSCPECIISG
jgi:hypothetical protein